VVIRGATDNFMDDIERALDDAVNNFKCLTRDGRYLPGAGATEIELATQLSAYADTLPGLDQYAVRKFANALEVFPKALAENSGINGTDIVNQLYLAHTSESGKTIGFDIEAEKASTIDTSKAKLFDLYQSTTHRCPNPLAVAKVRFIITVSKVLLRHYPVMITYRFEGYNTLYYGLGERCLNSFSFQRFFIDTILHTKLTFFAAISECRHGTIEKPKHNIKSKHAKKSDG